MAGRERSAGVDQRAQRLQARLGVVAQAARIVIHQVGQVWAAVADFQQLVDLFLVLDQRKTDARVVDWENALGPDRVLVQRHGNSPQ